MDVKVVKVIVLQLQEKRRPYLVYVDIGHKIFCVTTLSPTEPVPSVCSTLLLLWFSISYFSSSPFLWRPFPLGYTCPGLRSAFYRLHCLIFVGSSRSRLSRPVLLYTLFRRLVSSRTNQYVRKRPLHSTVRSLSRLHGIWPPDYTSLKSTLFLVLT